MRTSTLAIIAGSLSASLMYVNRSRTRRPAMHPRYGGQFPTITELRAEHDAQAVEMREAHARSHRYAVTLNPHLRGSRCHACGEVMC